MSIYEEVRRLIAQMSTEELEALAEELEKRKQPVTYEDKLEKIREEERRALEAIEKSDLPSFVKEAAKRQVIDQFAQRKLELTRQERKRIARREAAEAKVREALGLVPPSKPAYAEVPAPELIGYVERKKEEVKQIEQKIERGEEPLKWMMEDYEMYKALEQIASQIPPEKKLDPNYTVKVPPAGARTLGFNVEELQKIGKIIPNLFEGIKWYITGKIDPEKYEEVSAAVKTAGAALMALSPAGTLASGALAATGIGAPAAGVVAGVTSGLGLIGWWLSDNVAGRIDLIKYQLDKEKGEAEKQQKYEEAQKLREKAEAAKELADRFKSRIYSIKELENVADSWLYAKQPDQALRVLDQVAAQIQELKRQIEENKDNLPSEQHYVSLLESLAAVENILQYKRALARGQSGGRYLSNAAAKEANALKVLSDFHEKWFEERKQIDVSNPTDRKLYESYQKVKENSLRSSRTLMRLVEEESRSRPYYTYQKSKLTHKTGRSYEDPYLYKMLRAIADARGKPTAMPEELPEVAGLPSHVLDYPIIAKLLTWIMYNPKTPLAVMPNSYWEHKSGKEYSSLDRYLMIVALNQAGVSVADVSHLKDYELEAILRFRQYMYAAAKRGYFLPWEYECYTRFKELMLVDDDLIAAILGMEVPEEVREKIGGEKILDIGGETIISPYEARLETGA
jgi:hypothetical protein